MRGFAQPDLHGTRQVSAFSLNNEVQADAVKSGLLGGAKSNISHLAGNAGAVRMTILRQHHGQAVNNVVEFWCVRCGERV